VVGHPATETAVGTVTGIGIGTVREKGGQGAGAQGETTAGKHILDIFGTKTYGRSASGQHNPGNNLHVSGLSHKVDSRDLESAFLKIGRVRSLSTPPPHHC